MINFISEQLAYIGSQGLSPFVAIVGFTCFVATGVLWRLSNDGDGLDIPFALGIFTTFAFVVSTVMVWDTYQDMTPEQAAEIVALLEETPESVSVIRERGIASHEDVSLHLANQLIDELSDYEINSSARKFDQLVSGENSPSDIKFGMDSDDSDLLGFLSGLMEKESGS